ncbi:hypothetical protein [Motilimonas sp. KMU-193]|uniref:hypothetical protein n=1 Tax=Motilimonas sp. KMU-193 TaxID=3388668 RepID=UPI00396B0B39
MSKEQLLKLIGALIRVSDGDLVNKCSCFPCPQDQHEYYKVIRDCFQAMYWDADYTKSRAFKKEISGKSDNFTKMKVKMLSAPIKRQAHKDKLLEQLCDLNQLDNAYNYINIEHKPLFTQAVENLGKCNDK